MKNKTHSFICCFGSGPGHSWRRADIFWFWSRVLAYFRGLSSLERTSLLRSGGRRVCAVGCQLSGSCYWRVFSWKRTGWVWFDDSCSDV